MKLEKNKSLKSLTTFKIGGKAKFFFAPKTFDETKTAFLFAKKNNLKTFVLGKGSNILLDDRGFSGVVIYNNLNHFRIFKSQIYVGAGFSFPKLGVLSAKNDLSGLEFAAGVPGSVGGAIYMNASAYGQAVSDTLISVQYLNEAGIVESLKKNEAGFAYRTSCFQKNNGIILSASFALKKDTLAKDKQMETLQKKRKNQPLNEKNAGCVFKNPKNGSARKLIEECNLKDHQLGGAKISSQHTNFIINEKNATSEDILKLISYIKDVVKRKKNILLKEEVKYIPY